MNYEEAREYLRQVNIYGSVLGLDTIKELFRRLGDPHKELKVVHVAGTNGKGSTITFLQSILMEAGYKVGHYSSPAVFDYREIIKVDDQMIDEDSLAEHISNIKEKCDEMVADGMKHPTPFEIETAMAFMHLKKQQCDICLVECGMGGETDATNVFDKVLCSVITNISLDHMQFLGNTVTDIAKIKSGIIKESCPIVMAEQLPAVIDVIKSVAKDKKTNLIIASAPLEKINKACSNIFKYTTSEGKNINASLKMLGTYQFKNAAVAVEVALILEKQGFDISDSIVNGLEKAVWPGRMEIIKDNPLFIIDGAHNPEAVKELSKTIDLYFTNKRIAFIMGVLSDKDFNAEAELIASRATHIITVTPNNPRALEAERLKDTLSLYNSNVTKADTLGEAASKALDLVDNNQTDMIIAFGSLSYLGELKEIVQKA